jgi:histidine triad (HIT) family protein
MRKVFRCEGISTRQHNGPAGDQDVWHYHLHVIPRYPDDGLHAGRKVPYASGERIELAARLRAALHQVPLACEPDGRDLHAGHSSN